MLTFYCFFSHIFFIGIVVPDQDLSWWEKLLFILLAPFLLPFILGILTIKFLDKDDSIGLLLYNGF